MKKAVLVLAAALAAGAYAAPEKVLELEFADQNAMITAAGKVGEFSGVPTLGPLAMMGIANNPFASELGAPRAGARARVAIFVDSVPKTAATFCDVASHTFFVVLYPTSRTKEQFIEAKGKAAKDEGLFVKYDGMAYQFSQDGKWVAFSEVKNVNIAKSVLASADASKSFAEGDVARLTVAEKGFGLLVDLLNSPDVKAKLQELPNAKLIGELSDAVASLSGLELMLRVTDLGVDLYGGCTMKPGSKYEHIGEIPLSSATPLAFAGRDSVFAAAYGKGMLTWDVYKYFAGFKGIFEKRGVKTGFFDVAKAGSTTTLSLDIPAAIAYFTGEGKAALAKAFEGETPEAIVKEVSDLMPTVLFDQPEQAISLRIKGLAAYATPTERIARAVPDLGSRKYTSMGVGSLYSILKGVVGIVAETPVLKEQKDSVKGLLATLPPETGADIVFLSWREGADIKGLIRFTPAEIKGLVTGVTTVLATATAGKSTKPVAIPADADDDDD